MLQEKAKLLTTLMPHLPLNIVNWDSNLALSILSNFFFFFQHTESNSVAKYLIEAGAPKAWKVNGKSSLMHPTENLTWTMLTCPTHTSVHTHTHMHACLYAYT